MSPKSLNKVLEDVGADYCISLVQQREDISRYLKEDRELTVKKASLNDQLNELQKQVIESGDSQDMLESTKQKLHNVKEEIAKIERPPSYSLVLDNLDIMITVSDMTSDNQNRDNHWCNHNAVTDRVNPLEYCDDKPIADILDLPNAAILPSPAEQKGLMKDFVVIVSRIFVEHFKSFGIFKDIVPSHIQHKHSEELKKKSSKVTKCLV